MAGALNRGLEQCLAPLVARQDADDISTVTRLELQKRFMDQLGFDFDVMLKARKAINSFSDEKIDRAMRFAQKVGFDKALRDVDEIDFQGRTLLDMIRKPAAYATLAYLLGLYLPEFRF